MSNKVIISHFVSPDEFYLQNYNDLKELNGFMEDIQRSASLFPISSVNKPVVGELYFARIFFNSPWYRAEVTGVHTSNSYDKRDRQIRFQLVDYGNREFVRTTSRKNFRLIREKYIEDKPFFAFKAKLAGVVNTNKNNFEQKAEHLMKDSKFFMRIINDDGFIKSVKLAYPDGEDLATSLFQQGMVELERKSSKQYEDTVEMRSTNRVLLPDPRVKKISHSSTTQCRRWISASSPVSKRTSSRDVRDSTTTKSVHHSSLAGVAGVRDEENSRHSAQQQIMKSKDIIPGNLINIPETLRNSMEIDYPQDPRKTNNNGQPHTKESLPQGTFDKNQNDVEQVVQKEKSVEVENEFIVYNPSVIEVGRKDLNSVVVVERSSLASVSSPNTNYEHILHEELVNNELLSSLHLETIACVMNQHRRLLPDGSRAGFLLGDGLGVGKGRTLAGLIFENFCKGIKRALWISASTDAQMDIERDLSDIGANHIGVHSLKKMRYDNIISPANRLVNSGVLFSTYSTLTGESRPAGAQTSRTRLDQLLMWCGKDFHGIIIFDNCDQVKDNFLHGESNKLTKSGAAVIKLQNQLPDAKIIYVSSPGILDPRNMAFMVRLGLWGPGTPFEESNDFIKATERGGLGAKEILAMDMKQRGIYVARQLSFKDVTFKIDIVPLSPKFVNVYDDSVKLWSHLMKSFSEAAALVKADSKMRKTMWSEFWLAHQRFFQQLSLAPKVMQVVKVASEAVKCGKRVVISLQSVLDIAPEQTECVPLDFALKVSSLKLVLQNLVRKHFPMAPCSGAGLSGIKLLPNSSVTNITKNDEIIGEVISSKRKASSESSERNRKRKLESEDCYIISDCETEESDEECQPIILKTINGQVDLISLRKNGSKSCSEDSKNKKTNGPVQQPSFTNELTVLSSMKDRLLVQIEQLGARLPKNVIDQLVDELGGPNNVADLTGRKNRLVQRNGEQVCCEFWSETTQLEKIGLSERLSFLNGEKMFMIISEDTRKEISLRSDQRTKNRRRITHIALELPPNVDEAIEQFSGRTNCINQASAPEYVLLVTDLVSERRSASSVAKRLESLGALYCGDRLITESNDSDELNVDSFHGREALDTTLKAITGRKAPITRLPTDYNGELFRDMASALFEVGLISSSHISSGELIPEKDHTNVSKFLSRILGMRVELQNRLFKFFIETFTVTVNWAKSLDVYDKGISYLMGWYDFRRTKLQTFLHPTGMFNIELHHFEVGHEVSWLMAVKKIATMKEANEGFYLTNEAVNGKRTLVMVQKSTAYRHDENTSETLYTVTHSVSGLILRQETLTEIKRKAHQITQDEARPIFYEFFNSPKMNCLHVDWYGSCPQSSKSVDCQYGISHQTFHVLTGTVFSVWTKIESVLTSNLKRKMKFVQLRSGGTRVVGIYVPSNDASQVINLLTKEAWGKITEKYF